MPFTKNENLYELMVNCLHCKEREWDLVGVLENVGKGQRDVTMQLYGNYCEILASCRKRWPMEHTTTFTRHLRPRVTMTVIPATTHPTNSTILYFF